MPVRLVKFATSSINLIANRMNKRLLIAILSIMALQTHAQTPDRSQVEDKYKWNLSDMYPTVDAWKAEVSDITSRIDKLAAYKGKLGSNASTLHEALTAFFGVLKAYYKAATYAGNLSNENLNIAANQALDQQITSIGTRFGEATAFMEPEILSIPRKKMQKFFRERPALQEFSMYIDNIQRLQAHTLSEAEEKILASFGLIAGNASDVYGIFTNAEMPFETVTLASGEEATLTPAGFTRYRSVPNRDDRKKIFEAFFNNYGQFENTLGANLAGKVKKDWVYAKNRKYASSLEGSLAGDNLPVDIYTTLIEQVNNNLQTLHRALDLKKRMLGLDELHYYDLYVPLVDRVEMNFTIEQGQNVLLDALKPLGNEYLSVLKKAYHERWIDYLPTTGKRSGAYSNGSAYDVHPYILMNWTGDFESVSTLGHELGHTMHSYFSNKNQPFAKAGYAIFVAEIASTVNETLLNNYMVKNAKHDEEKLYILGSYLELLRTTVFRQTSFAEFEWEIHKKVEAGEPITGEDMSAIYMNIVRKYYGSESGHTIVDDYIQYEWAYIPHFLNYTYYVFQYATSLIYGTALVEKMLAEGQPAVDRYYAILNGGGSKYPSDLIREAGIDPMSPEPVQLTMKKMNDVMDQMEDILKKMGR